MNLAAVRRAIVVYLLVSWTVSFLFYFLIIKSAGTNAANGSLRVRPDVAPRSRALLTCKYLGRPIASLEWQLGPNALPSN